MNRLKESFYLAMIILGMLALSFHLANAQTRPPAPTPNNKNQKFIYMRSDTVFQMESDGVEVPLLPMSIDEEMRRGRIVVEIDTVQNSLVYRPKPGHVVISSLYGDSLWVTDKIFVTVHRFDDSIIIRDKPGVYEFGWVTDSIKWVATDTMFKGDCKCEHDWVFGEPNYDVSGSGLSIGCLVDHNGGHCDYDDDVREKICRKCMRSVIEREKWYHRFVAPPKSEFEILKEKQRAKR